MKKILSVVLIVMMILTSFATVNVFADGGAVFTLDNVTGQPGSSVKVKLLLSSSEEINSIAVSSITYDTDLLIFEGFSDYEHIEDLTILPPTFDEDKMAIVIALKNATAFDGDICTLNFKIKDDAEDCTTTVNATSVTKKGSTVIASTVTPSIVTVQSQMLGDIDGNLSVDIDDAVRLFEYSMLPDLYPISYIGNVDFDSNGSVDIDDAVRLFNYSMLPDLFPIPGATEKPKCEHSLTEVPYKAPTSTENGNIAYWVCSECNKLFKDADGKVSVSLKDTVIPKVEGAYTITYYVDNNDEYLQSLDIVNSNPEFYYSETGVELQDLHVNGYNFVGWFTAQTGGTQVTEIPAGTTGNKTLYAHWEKVGYTVQFESTMVPVNDIVYSAGEERTLPKPELDKYTFVGWSDKDGNMWDTIPKGTAKNLVLYANWSSNRNKAVAVSNLKEPLIMEDSEAGLILFTYEIGEIQNVPLFTTLNLQCANGIITTISKTETEEIGTDEASTIAQTISNATTNSSTWTLESNWNNATEVSQSYIDQTNQTREEAESLAKSKDETYNVGTSKGGSGSMAITDSGAFRLSKNTAHSNISTTETGQDFNLSVDGKFSSETSIGVGIPIEGIDLNAGAKYGFEIGAGVDYGNYIKNTNTGTDSWSRDTEISGEITKALTAEKNWNTSEGYSSSKSTSTNTTIANAVSKLISEEYGYGSSYAEGGSNSSSQAWESSDSKSNEFSSTLTYHTSKISSTTTTFQSTGEQMGSYRMVMAGKIHVFAVVGYDIAEQTYFVYTYNVLDDKTEEYLDYSYDHSFNDYETSIIPFEVPVFVNDYVNTRIAKTDGLQIDPDTGIIENYVPDADEPATVVFVPSYVSIYNDDNTYQSVKVTGISEGLFKNNTDIVGVRLGNFITEIPDSAFEGCSSLEYVIAPGVTKIGDNAFNGCTSLGEFTIPMEVTEVGENAFVGVPKVNSVAANAEVAKAVASSGAKNVVLDISNAEGISNTTFEVGNIESFELMGKNQQYSGLRVKSDAETTVINGVNFVDCEDTPMHLSSKNITLNRVTANAPGYALVIDADDADVLLNQTVTLTSTSGKAVLIKNTSFASLNTSVVGKMKLTGDMLVAGTLNGTNLITFEEGEIVYITEEEFEDALSGVNIIFDANGGTVSTASKNVPLNSSVGELPTPAYGDYTFLGWYTESNGGTKVTEDTVISSVDGITVYAKWNNWDGTSTEPSYNVSTKTYTITTGNELAWISDVTNGVITTGTNFPDDISFSGYTIELANDIYLNDTTDWESWSELIKPKNEWRAISYNYDFQGTFDGNSYRIYGLYCNSRDAGLFDSVDNGVLKNIIVSDSYVYGKNRAAGIVVAAENTTIDNCKNYAIAVSEYKVGGIAADVYSSAITNCYNMCNLTSDDGTVGGIVGEGKDSQIELCGNLGDITVSRSTESLSYTGGIVGEVSNSIISYCYNKGNVSGNHSTGGIAGEIIEFSSVLYSYNTGNISGGTVGCDVGGIVGGCESSTVADCFSKAGHISGNWRIGGIVGYAHPGISSNRSDSNIRRCYQLGMVSGDSYVNSILGMWTRNGTYWLNLTNCYGNGYDLYYADTDSIKYLYASNVGYKSTSEMQNLSNLPGFSTTVWAIDPNINDGYPYLKALKDTY